MNCFKVRRLALLLLLPLVFGCPSLQIENMVTDQTPLDTQHPVMVAVKVSGGSPSVQLFSMTISPEAFQEAVMISLEKSALFNAIVYKDTAKYLLDVDLTWAGSHPGPYMTAWVNATWILSDRASGDNVWSADIRGKGQATGDDAFWGAYRQYIALERGAKANIDQALTQIRELDLGSPAAIAVDELSATKLTWLFSGKTVEGVGIQKEKLIPFKAYFNPNGEIQVKYRYGKELSRWKKIKGKWWIDDKGKGLVCVKYKYSDKKRCRIIEKKGGVYKIYMITKNGSRKYVGTWEKFTDGNPDDL